ncbi:unnamed protein product [Rhizoctonia solani]|uniref:Cyclin N-terminal domain-containing protein n=1 Tax=Rhizoctonia solani TaxID=456999 RepID=A0A8H3C7T4_9AGAM|nr:unnamed protein product [Rhizoctonia solani]
MSTIVSIMHTTTLHPSSLPSLPSLSPTKPRVIKSPYPVARTFIAPAEPARKAYRQLKSMLSKLKPTKTSKVTTALGHVNNAQSQCHELPAPTNVAPGHPNTSQPQPHETTVPTDEFYGWAQVAKTSARFIATLLDCPETLPSTDPTEINPDLAHFIALALHRSHMPLSIHQYALHLVWRVKLLKPEFKPKHAHGTYLTALMLAAKQSHDGAYSINDWAAIGNHIFEPSQLRENEWRMCERLEWRFLVHPMDLVKLAWTIEVGYGELDEDVPLTSGGNDNLESEIGLGGMFSASVASSLESLSTSSSGCSLSSPWSGWGEATPSGSSISTPDSMALCDSSSPSPFILA